MSAAARAQRAAVFAVFSALAAGQLFLLVRAPAPQSLDADLEKLQTRMVEEARLHPEVHPPAPAGSGRYCAGCHPSPPHAGRRVAAAMANEHASRIDCLVCHWSAAGGARPAPAWQILSGLTVLALPAERSSPEQLTALRSVVTASHRCFERGPECARCHRPGGMASLMRPGSDPGRLGVLERLEDYFRLPPGETWYFPQLK